VKNKLGVSGKRIYKTKPADTYYIYYYYFIIKYIKYTKYGSWKRSSDKDLQIWRFLVWPKINVIRVPIMEWRGNAKFG